MPKIIKDENGNDIEVFTKEEMDEANKNAVNEAVKPIRETMGLKDGDDLMQGVTTIKKQADEKADWRSVRDGKTKTEQKAREDTIAKLKEQGVDAEINERGEVVIKQQQNNNLTASEIEEITRKTLAEENFKNESSRLLSSLPEDKRVDIQNKINELKGSGVQGDANQLFRMSLAALGVPAPVNMNNIPGGYPNGFPMDNNMNNTPKGDYADTDRGRNIMRQMGVSEELIKHGETLSDKPRMIEEGRVAGDGKTRIANQHDVIK